MEKRSLKITTWLHSKTLVLFFPIKKFGNILLGYRMSVELCLSSTVSYLHNPWTAILNRENHLILETKIWKLKEFIHQLVTRQLLIATNAFLQVIKSAEYFAHWSRVASWKDKVNYKIYDVTTWLTNNYITHIAKYLTK